MFSAYLLITRVARSVGLVGGWGWGDLLGSGNKHNLPISPGRWKKNVICLHHLKVTQAWQGHWEQCSLILGGNSITELASKPERPLPNVTDVPTWLPSDIGMPYLFPASCLGGREGAIPPPQLLDSPEAGGRPPNWGSPTQPGDLTTLLITHFVRLKLLWRSFI